jgi:hypothetical protein
MMSIVLLHCGHQVLCAGSAGIVGGACFMVLMSLLHLSSWLSNSSISSLLTEMGQWTVFGGTLHDTDVRRLEDLRLQVPSTSRCKEAHEGTRLMDIDGSI